MKRLIVALVALALASPAWSKDWDNPVTRSLLKYSDESMLSDREPPRDPFEDTVLFSCSCMLKEGFRYCRNCTSSYKGACHRNRWAPFDVGCGESITFPLPHPLGELP
jgi:hypothetical protein